MHIFLLDHACLRIGKELMTGRCQLIDGNSLLAYATAKPTHSFDISRSLSFFFSPAGEIEEIQQIWNLPLSSLALQA